VVSPSRGRKEEDGVQQSASILRASVGDDHLYFAHRECKGREEVTFPITTETL